MYALVYDTYLSLSDLLHFVEEALGSSISLELTQMHSFLWLSDSLWGCKESDTNEELSLSHMYHKFFIHSSVHGHLGCFHVLAIVNNAAVNNGIHTSFSIFVSSGYKPRSGIAGSCGGFIPSF